MALRLLAKSATAVARPSVLAASRSTALGATALRRSYTTPNENQPAPQQKAQSIIDSLPGNSFVSKTGYLTLGTGLATFLISKEIYVFNEETLVVLASGGLLAVVLKYLREPYTTMANDHINRIKSILNQARNDHRAAVNDRITEVGQLKDLVDVTKALFELSRETASLEAEAFKLKQQVAVAHEVKGTLDSWVRHEANVREREQKQLASYLIDKILKDLQDPKIQQQVLDQAVVDVQKLAKSH